jgi:hypothetical protein
MECEICGQEVENSEDLQKHKERLHPVGDRDDSMLEKPDLLDKPDLMGEQEPETPEPAQKRR